MRIVVDADIWGGATLFADMGDVVLRPGRAIRASDVAHADALVVRSVTPVDEALLDGSNVGFVGTATTGVDHVDVEYLSQRGIAFATAAGSNARPVVEYILACLFEWRRRTGGVLSQATLGIVGVGRIGRGVMEWGQALGMRILAVDPPLERAGVPGLAALDDMLDAADIVTLHVPLTAEGLDATKDLIDARRLARMKPGAWLINAARGGVIVESDLYAAVDAGRLGGVILDVWSGEPIASPRLLQTATLLTPHMAGYSEGAHRRAAIQIAAALRLCIVGRIADDTGLAPPAELRPLPLPDGGLQGERELQILGDEIKRICDVVAIDAEYRQLLKEGLPAAAFDTVRAGCRKRLGLTDIEIEEASSSPEMSAVLANWAGRR